MRSVASEPEQVAGGGQEDQIVARTRGQRDQSRQVRAAAPSAPRARKQRRESVEAPGQRDRGIERQAEDERAPIVLLAELLEAGRHTLLGP